VQDSKIAAKFWGGVATGSVIDGNGKHIDQLAEILKAKRGNENLIADIKKRVDRNGSGEYDNPIASSDRPTSLSSSDDEATRKSIIEANTTKIKKNED
jgi:hypothetical protein